MLSVVAALLLTATFPKNSIPVSEFSDDALAPVRAKFDERVQAGDKTVLFQIDSRGGEVETAIDFIQHIEDAKKAKGVRVQCVVRWKAFSMGFVFFERACDDRFVVKSSVLMIHGTRAVIGAEDALASVDEVTDSAANLDTLNDMLAGWCAERLGIPKQAFARWIAHNERWFSPDRALAAHVADREVREQDLPLPYELKAKSVKEDLESLLNELTK